MDCQGFPHCTAYCTAWLGVGRELQGPKMLGGRDLWSICGSEDEVGGELGWLVLREWSSTSPQAWASFPLLPLEMSTVWGAGAEIPTTD